MGWTLDQQFFRYLVGLYSISFVLVFGAVGYETFGPGWQEFSTGFDLLVDQHFGTTSDTTWMVIGAVLLVILVWHLISLIGLRKFSPWSRWSFWASWTLATFVTWLPGMSTPWFTGPLGSLTTEVSAGLFAAIVLLAYSRDHGGLWFKSRLETLKETF